MKNSVDTTVSRVETSTTEDWLPQPSELSGSYLGPARVGRVAKDEMHLFFPDQEIRARSALTISYEPVVGDIVLVIGQFDHWYVIGVLKGSGSISLRAPGDLRLSALGGTIDLSSSEGVNVHSPIVRIVAGRLECVAKMVVERFVNAYRHVRQAFHLRAKEVLTTADGGYRLKADRIVQRAAGNVHIDGRKIHLG